MLLAAPFCQVKGWINTNALADKGWSATYILTNVGLEWRGWRPDQVQCTSELSRSNWRQVLMLQMVCHFMDGLYWLQLDMGEFIRVWRIIRAMQGGIYSVWTSWRSHYSSVGERECTMYVVEPLLISSRSLTFQGPGWEYGCYVFSWYRMGIGGHTVV